MTSNSPAKLSTALPAAVMAIALLGACTQETVAPPVEHTTPSAAPAPALDRAVTEPIGEAFPDPGRSRIVEAVAEPVSGQDERLVAIVHHDDLARFERALLFTVQVAEPFDAVARTASPVIVVNGEPLTNTVVVGPNRVVLQAAMPITGEGDGRVSVQTGWFGSLERTISEPVVISVPGGTPDPDGG
jgi:hypothetical protein